MAGETQGRSIFISYRRDDSEGEAGRLYDDLVRAYSDDSVFMDVSGIQPGLDFRKAIDANVSGCGVLLAIIGPTWASITGSDGTRRLDNPDDYVRLEIASALKRGVPVIPVLVHESHMPALDQLPDDLKDLRYRNSVELTHARWNSDVALLIGALKSYVSVNTASQAETVHATIPVQLPAPQAAPPVHAAGKSRMPLFAGLGAVAVLILAVAGFFLFKNRGATGQQPTNPAASTQATTAPESTTPPVSSNPTTTTPAAVTQTAQTTATPVTQPASAPAASAAGGSPEVGLIGIWKTTAKVGPQSDTLVQLSILEFGGQFSARAYGSCLGRPCDWGMRKLTLDNGFAVSQEPWEPRNTDKETSLQRKVSVSMALNGDTLLVTLKNQTIDPTRGHLFSMRDMQFKKDK